LRRHLLVAVPCAGCLSTPPPATIDAGPPDAMPCDHDPRPSQACADRGALLDEAFPGGDPFELRQVVVDDLDADGALDLIAVDLDGDQIFVLLGPIDPAAPRYHASFATGIDVGGIDVQQVAGTSPCPDLTVFGKVADDPGIVQLWVATGGGATLFDDPPRRRFVDFSPKVFAEDGSGLPVKVAWARLHSTDEDLQVSDINTVRLLHVHGDVAGFEDVDIDTVMHVLPATEFWDSVEELHVVPTADCAIDGAVIAEGNHAHVLEVGAATGGGPAVATDARTRGARPAEMNQEPPLDLVLAGAEEVGAYHVEYAGGDELRIAADPPWRELEYDLAPTDYILDGFAVGYLGGDAARADFAGIDVGTGVPHQVMLIENFDVSGAEPQNTRVYDDLPAEFVPRDVVIADLVDGNPAGEAEIVVIAVDGRIVCLLPDDTTGQLEPCD
jgi:hypothetical protein